MRKRIIVLFFILSLIPFLFGELGFIYDYTIEGEGVGRTKIQGSIKIQMIPDSKRLTCDFFYLEAGNPFPDLNEKDIIINYSKNEKSIFISEFNEWIDSQVDLDFDVIEDDKLTITTSKDGNDVSVIIAVEQEPEFGGKQKFSILLTYPDKSPKAESDAFKQFKKPLGADFLSIYLDNEKLVEVINKNLGVDAFRIPEKFTLRHESEGEIQVNVRGSLTIKLDFAPPDGSFSH